MLNVENLNFKYGKNKVLNDVSFKLTPGHCMAILGNNGAGKSTVIKCLNKILTPMSGNIYINDTELKKFSRIDLAKEIAYVAQRSETTNITVFDTILLGRKPYIKFQPSKKDYDIVDNLIEKLDLNDISLKIVDHLSGGQFQKVMVARALAQEPKILLLDEPTSCLDIKSQHEILGLVNKIAIEQNISVLLVVHDLNLALRYCDRLLLLKDNKVYLDGNIDDLNEETIKSVFGINVIIEKISGFKTIIPV